MGIRSLAPRVYEGGGPKGRGEKRSILPNSPSHDFRRASPLLKAGAEGAVQTGGSYQEIATSGFALPDYFTKKYTSTKAPKAMR